MMRDRPSGAELLALLREVLRRDAERPAERRTPPALVERAVAIAGRERREGDGLGACQARLAAIYGAGDQDALLRRFAADIRAGAFDAPSPDRQAVRDLLWTITVRKLRESNPGFLAASGIDPAQSA